MRLSLPVLLCLTLLSLPLTGQETVVFFPWNSSVLTPQIGPAATSAGPYVTLSPDGRDGTNGLSAGLKPGGDPSVAADRAAIDLTVPYMAELDVDGIDISIDFQRDEDDGELVSRGNFVFGVAAGAYVNFEILDPEEGAISGFDSPVFPVDPNDDVWHRLRFTYDQFVGEAKLYLDGALVWELPFTTPGQVLYWSPGADLKIGDGIDGGGVIARRLVVRAARRQGHRARQCDGRRRQSKRSRSHDLETLTWAASEPGEISVPRCRGP